VRADDGRKLLVIIPPVPAVRYAFELVLAQVGKRDR
jgi:hypothetical protein